jgi:hypothetical protein
MRIFPRPNMTNGFRCPICKASSSFPVVLVPIPGTEDGNLVECEQIHADCYRLICKMHDCECEIEDEMWTTCGITQ